MDTDAFKMVNIPNAEKSERGEQRKYTEEEIGIIDFSEKSFSYVHKALEKISNGIIAIITSTPDDKLIIDGIMSKELWGYATSIISIFQNDQGHLESTHPYL